MLFLKVVDMHYPLESPEIRSMALLITKGRSIFLKKICFNFQGTEILLLLNGIINEMHFYAKLITVQIDESCMLPTLKKIFIT